MSEDLKLVRAQNEEVVRHRVNKLVLGSEEADRASYRVHDFADFNIDLDFGHQHTPYRYQTYTKLTEMVTNIAIRRFKSEARILNKAKVISWLDNILAENEHLKGQELLMTIFEGTVTARARESTKKAKIDPHSITTQILSHREEAAEELTEYLKGVKGDNARLSMSILQSSLELEMDDAEAEEHRKKFGSL